MSYRDYSFVGLVAVVFVMSILAWYHPLSLADNVDVSTTVTSGGSSAPTIIPTPVISKITALPEKRSTEAGDNYDTDFYFSIHDPITHQQLYRSSSFISSDTPGHYVGAIEIPDLPEGEYDILIKSKSHLTRRMKKVNLKAGDNAIELVDPAGDSAFLLAGDIDGSGDSIDTVGDDVVNAVDLSVLLSQLNLEDPSGNSVRANLNQDQQVDQNDLIILLSNLDKEGEKFK